VWRYIVVRHVRTSGFVRSLFPDAFSGWNAALKGR
jgi:hypothetical protein